MINPALENVSDRPKITYREFENTLADGEELTITRQGDFLTCLEATAGFQLGYDNGETSTFKQGLTFRPLQVFNSVQIVNNSGAPNTITLGIGRGDIRDSRLNLSGSIAAEPVVPNTLETAFYALPATAASMLYAADATRKEVFITNEGAAKVYINDNQASAKGIPLSPGQTVFLQTSAAIYCYNPDAATQMMVYGVLRSV